MKELISRIPLAWRERKCVANKSSAEFEQVCCEILVSLIKLTEIMYRYDGGEHRRRRRN